MKHSLKREIPRVVVAAAQIAALGWMESPADSRRGFPLDDAWIHQVVARTFATTGTLGYAPGQHGAGATSFLWALTLSLNPRLIHAPPPLFTLFVNGALFLLVGQLWFTLLLRVRGLGATRTPRSHRVTIAAVATVVGTCGGNFVWFAASGMESLMLAAFSLLAIRFATGRSGTRPLLFAGVFAGLAGLTRPEALPFGLVLPFALVLVGRSKKRALLTVPGWLVAAIAYAGVNFAATGKASPATLAGRKWLWVEENAGFGFVDNATDFVDTWVGRLRDYTLGTSSTAAMWIALGVSGAGLFWAATRSRSGLRVALLWMAMHTGMFLVLLPTPGHGGRYQPWVPLLFGSGLVLGAHGLVLGVARRAPTLLGSRPRVVLGATLGLTLPWIALMLVGLRDWRTDQLSAVRHVDATERGMGYRVNQLEQGAIVASFDIGGIGYEAKRPILDVGGLSDPSFVSLFANGAVASYLRKAHVDYVVLPLPYEDDLPVLSHFGYRLHLTDNHGLTLEPVTELMSDLAQWGPGVGATWNASPKQVLFRVTYHAEDARFAATTGAPSSPARIEGVPATRRDALRIDHALRVLAGTGVPVALRVGTPADVDLAEANEVTDVRVSASKRTCTVRLSSDYGGIPGLDEALRKSLASTTKRYFDANDPLGAASVALRVVADEVGKHRPDRPRPLLPPARLPNPDGLASRDWVSVGWGAPVTLAVLVALAFFAGFPSASRRLPRGRKA